MNFIEKIEDLQKQICCLKNSSGNPDIDLVDNGNGTFKFTNGVDAPVTFDAKKTIVVDNGDNTFTLTDDFGTTVIIDTNDVTTTLVDNPNKTFTYTNELSVPVTVDYKIATITDNGDKTFTYTDDFGSTGVIDTNDALTTYVDDVIAGNKIGTYTDEAGNPTDVTETITFMNQQANGDIEYLSEDGSVDTTVILSTDAGQLLKTGSDLGNLLVGPDLISSDANNAITAGTDGKLFSPIVSVFPDDQVFTGISTDTATVTLTPLTPTPEGQIDYNLQIDVKTQCEIDSNSSGIKLSDGFYENIGTAHLTNIANVQVFDPAGDLLEANVVKDGCGLKIFVNKPETILFKNNGLSEAGFYSLVDITVGGKAPDVISLIINDASANIDFSNWYANTLILGKKVGQKFVVALNIGTPLYSLTFDHGGSGLVKGIFDQEILTVKALEADTLYED